MLSIVKYTNTPPSHTRDTFSQHNTLLPLQLCHKLDPMMLARPLECWHVYACQGTYKRPFPTHLLLPLLLLLLQ